MSKLKLNTAESNRVKLTKKQQDQIRRLYKRVSKKIGQQAQKIPATQSDVIRQKYLNKLQDQINNELNKIVSEIEGTVMNNMTQIASDVVDDNLKWLESVGMPVGGAFSHVPDDVVKSVATGKVYSKKWSFSKAIWGANEKTQKDINTIVAEGIAQNKSAYDIAKDLEKYVDPSARKDWSWSKVYPGTNKKVDYSAQRLARTLVSHAYQQAFVKTTQKNPFVTKYQWVGSNSHRICPICIDRDGKLFDKDALPLDHPNGMCTFVAVIEDSMEDIADRIEDWANGKEDSGLDAYAKDLYGHIPEALKKSFNVDQDKWLSPLGYSPTNMPGTFKEFAKQLTYEQQTELLKLAGGTWSDDHPFQKMEAWYKSNLLSPKGGTKIKSKKTTKSSTKKTTRTRKKAATPKTATPPKEQWISIIRNQTESEMLNLESRAFGKMTQEEKGGIRVYTGSSYEEMNKYLRLKGTGLSPEEAQRKSYISDSGIEALKLVNSGLKKASLEKPLVLRRGTSMGDLAGFLSGDYRENKRTLRGMSASQLNNLFQGTIGTYHGFTSTSSLWDRGFRGEVEVLLYAPEGTSASSIMGISQYGTREGETLLNSDTRVRIVSVEESDGHKDSRIRVFMEIII